MLLQCRSGGSRKYWISVGLGCVLPAICLILQGAQRKFLRPHVNRVLAPFQILQHPPQVHSKANPSFCEGSRRFSPQHLGRSRSLEHGSKVRSASMDPTSGLDVSVCLRRRRTERPRLVGGSAGSLASYTQFFLRMAIVGWELSSSIWLGVYWLSEGSASRGGR